MSNVPAELKYIASHEWLRLEDDGTVTVGITDHAQDLLGDVVFVELPDVGDTIAVDDVYAPISGEVVAINEALEDDPEIINSDPYGEGWFFRMKPDNMDDYEALLSAEEYENEL
jgi:glycine cleavage system H protein